MVQQYTQSLRLIPSKYSNLFNVQVSLGFETRYIGKVDTAGEGTFTANRTERHLHRKSNSIGLNLELLKTIPFKWIVIFYCGERLVTSKEYMLHHGRIFSFSKAGFEKQCFLSLDQWGEDRVKEFERSDSEQYCLFAQAA